MEVIQTLSRVANKIIKKDERWLHLLETIRSDPTAKIVVFQTGKRAPIYLIRRQLESTGKKIIKENAEHLAWEGGGSIFFLPSNVHTKLRGLSGTHIYVDDDIPMETVNQVIVPMLCVTENKLFMVV